jgi:methyltransferase (TIGR00027 family)
MHLWASLTAEAVCLFRAVEHTRPADERAVDDPYAHLFLRPPFSALLRAIGAGQATARLAETLTFGLMPFVVARHRFIDEALLAALEAGEVERLVLLGAGYDTRPFRLAGPLAGVEVVEVDHPATARRRAEVIARHAASLPAIERRVLTVDFVHEDLAKSLQAEGITGARTFFVWEGVSMYLTRQAVRHTLRALTDASAPGSHLCLDLWRLVDDLSWRGTLLRTLPGALSIVGEPITFALHPEDAPAFLAREGWEVADLAGPEALSERFLQGDRDAYRATYVVHARRATG